MLNISAITNISRVKKFLRGTVLSGCPDGISAVAAGEEIIMFLVLRGEVGVFTGYRQPGAEMIRALGAGDFFADPGLLFDQKAAYTALSLSDVIIVPIERAAVPGFIQEEPALVYELLRELSLRLDQTSTAYKALIVQHDVACRRCREEARHPTRVRE